MIISSQLAGWLSAPGLQEAIYQRSHAFAERWRGHPLFLETARSVRDMETPSLEGALAIGERFLGRDDVLLALIDDLISNAIDDPFFQPPFNPLKSDISKGYVLFDSAPLAILLNVVSADATAARKAKNKGSGTVGFTGMVTLYRYLKSGGATLSIWEAPAADADFQASTQHKLRMTERRKINDGDIWLMDGRRETFIIEHAETDIVQIQARVKVDCAPLAVEYDINSGAFAGSTANDEASSRMQMMVSLLRLMGRDDEWPLVEKLLANPHFFARWYLMREFLAMNADAALPHLQRMAAEDPHPEVRASAKETLQRFFPTVAPMQGGTECRA